MSEVEEESDVTSQSCWQHVLCSALANPMPKNREIRPRSSKQLPNLLDMENGVRQQEQFSRPGPQFSPHHSITLRHGLRDALHKQAQIQCSVCMHGETENEFIRQVYDNKKWI